MSLLILPELVKGTRKDTLLPLIGANQQSLFRKQFGSLHQIFNLYMPLDPEIPLLEIYLKKCSHMYKRYTY